MRECIKFWLKKTQKKAPKRRKFATACEEGSRSAWEVDGGDAGRMK
jgi:hypothetical protein